MRSRIVVVGPPTFEYDPDPAERGEQCLVQQFFRSRPLKLSMEAFCVGLLGAMCSRVQSSTTGDAEVEASAPASSSSAWWPTTASPAAWVERVMAFGCTVVPNRDALAVLAA